MKAPTRHPRRGLAADGFSLREVRYSAELRQDRHHHEETTATLVFDGSLEEIVGSTREHARPLSVVFKPAGTEHANRIGPAGATTLQLSFDPDFFGASDAAPADTDWGWSHGGAPARRFLELFASWRCGEDDSSELEMRIFDVLAALRDRPGGTGRAPGWLRAVVEELHDTWQSPRRVRELAADAGVHPVALARAHRRCFGFSISDRIRSRRVEAAADLLARDVSLSEVAFRTGFSDQSHLTRVFKVETGLTPGRYRSLRLD